MSEGKGRKESWFPGLKKNGSLTYLTEQAGTPLRLY